MKYKLNHKCMRIIMISLIMIVLTKIFKFYNAINVAIELKLIDSNMKYILLWTKLELFKHMGLGQEGFIKRNCPFTNCFITSAKDYFNDIKSFHAIVFSMSDVMYYRYIDLPQDRSSEQKFVIFSIESSQIYPVCSHRFDQYFNWTWTYRVDSDCRFSYITIRDARGKLVGPKKRMHWIDVTDMLPVSAEFKNSLKSKTKVAAWFVSDCETKSQREVYIKALQAELAKYNHTIDIYGKCGNLSCPKGSKQCMEMIRSDYFFYLSFEKSLSMDFVTESVLYALKNNAIPVVYGGANYTRFMPDGIYLNALQLGPRRLARQMDILMNYPKKYAEYFKWQNHYSYHNRNESKTTDGYCALCKLLNNNDKFRKSSMKFNFQRWWDSPNFCEILVK